MCKPLVRSGQIYSLAGSDLGVTQALDWIAWERCVDVHVDQSEAPQAVKRPVHLKVLQKRHAKFDEIVAPQ